MCCTGCQALTTDSWGSYCEIVTCLHAQGYAFCYECAAFAEESREKCARLATRYAKRRVDVRANLRASQAGRADEWLQEQEQRWRCPGGGKPVTAWEDNCRWCGGAL